MKARVILLLISTGVGPAIHAKENFQSLYQELMFHSEGKSDYAVRSKLPKKPEQFLNAFALNELIKLPAKVLEIALKETDDPKYSNANFKGDEFLSESDNEAWLGLVIEADIFKQPDYVRDAARWWSWLPGRERNYLKTLETLTATLERLLENQTFDSRILGQANLRAFRGLWFDQNPRKFTSLKSKRAMLKLMNTFLDVLKIPDLHLNSARASGRSLAYSSFLTHWSEWQAFFGNRSDLQSDMDGVDIKLEDLAHLNFRSMAGGDTGAENSFGSFTSLVSSESNEPSIRPMALAKNQMVQARLSEGKLFSAKEDDGKLFIEMPASAFENLPPNSRRNWRAIEQYFPAGERVWMRIDDNESLVLITGETLLPEVLASGKVEFFDHPRKDRKVLGEDSLPANCADLLRLMKTRAKGL